MKTEPKEKRVRLNHNPWIKKETKQGMKEAQDRFGLSLGKLLDKMHIEWAAEQLNEEDFAAMEAEEMAHRRNRGPSRADEDGDSSLNEPVNNNQ